MELYILCLGSPYVLFCFVVVGFLFVFLLFVACFLCCVFVDVFLFFSVFQSVCLCIFLCVFLSVFLFNGVGLLCSAEFSLANLRVN